MGKIGNVFTNIEIGTENNRAAIKIFADDRTAEVPQSTIRKAGAE